MQRLWSCHPMQHGQPRAHSPSSQPQSKGQSQATCSPPATAFPARQSQSCPLSLLQPTSLASHANSLALSQNLQRAGCTAFLREAAVAMYPPSCLKAGHPGWQIAARVHFGPPPSPSLRHSISCWLTASPATGGASRGWDVGRGLLAREGVSPQPGCSPLAAVCMQGVKSTLTQREEQAEASEEQGGLQEPSFRAHFEGLLCVERTWYWCGFWWWWFAFFERPGYLQVTYNIRAALFPQPNMAGWSGAGSKNSVNAMVGGFHQGKWEGRKIFP